MSSDLFAGRLDVSICLPSFEQACQRLEILVTRRRSESRWQKISTRHTELVDDVDEKECNCVSGDCEGCLVLPPAKNLDVGLCPKNCVEHADDAPNMGGCVNGGAELGGTLPFARGGEMTLE